MIRCDKTLSELWHLRGSDNEEASDTAFMAISTIKRLQEENRKYENALREILNPHTNKWFDYKEKYGNEVSFQEFLKEIAKEALENS